MAEAHTHRLRRGSGLTELAAMPALNPARSLTSHARRRYRSRYAGRSLAYRSLFVGELVLFVAAVVGVGWLLAAWLTPPPAHDGLRVYLSAPPLESGGATALEVHVVNRGSDEVRDLRLQWQLPDATEVLRSNPLMTQAHEVTLDPIPAGGEAVARVAVRLFVSPGDIRLGFRLVSDQGVSEGSETRRIEGSSLRIEPLIQARGGVEGASIPFLVENRSAEALDRVELHAGFPWFINDGSSHLWLGTLEPFERRIVVLFPATGSPLRLTGDARSIALTRYEQPFELAETFPEHTVELAPSVPGRDAMAFVDLAEPMKLLIIHPLAEGGLTRTYDLPAGKQTLILPTGGTPLTNADRWYAIPFTKDEAGTFAIGQLVSSPITTPFGIEAQARYYAVSGGQLGSGPLPPRVGEGTKYWIQWKLHPTTDDLSDVRVSAPLGRGVRLTGNSALPAGGTVQEQDGRVEWTIPYLPANGEGAEAAFEVELMPTSDMRSFTPLLIGTTEAKAEQVDPPVPLEANVSEIDTNLPQDSQASGRGVIE